MTDFRRPVVVPAWTVVVVFAGLLPALAGLTFVCFRLNASTGRWVSRAAAAEGEAKRLRGRVGALEAELVEESDRAMRMEAEKAAREERLDKQMANPSGLTCQVMVLEWTARVEGEAGVPPLTLKGITQGKLVPEHVRKRLALAAEKYPPPDCVEGT